jgi:hypothetical protein
MNKTGRSAPYSKAVENTGYDVEILNENNKANPRLQ